MQDLKALVVVLVISATLFALSRPFAIRIIDVADFDRRRTVWFVLTIVAFLSPNFWLYAAVAAPLLIWASRRDKNPACLYFWMLFVVPPVRTYIPFPGGGILIDINQHRLLALVVLCPLIFELLSNKKAEIQKSFRPADWFLIGYAILQVALSISVDSGTGSLRRTVGLILNDIVVFYVFSRLRHTRSAVSDAMVSLCVISSAIAVVSVFEANRSWLLYQSVGSNWGLDALNPFLLRGGVLRAQVSTGHALQLGGLMAVSFAFSLYLATLPALRTAARACMALAWAGLIASYSRAPWVAAVLASVTAVGLGLYRGLRLWPTVATLAVATCGVLVSPLGDRIVEALPWIGSVDQQNVAYRAELARVLWTLFEQNPWFGDTFAMNHMESLRQGEGIIDLLNVYMSVAVFHGGVGLSLFSLTFLCCIGTALRQLIRNTKSDDDLSRMGVGLISGMLVVLVCIATGGLFPLMYPIAGLLMSYGQICTNDSIHEGFMITQPTSNVTSARRHSPLT